MDTRSAYDQARYQVRFDWGRPGLERMAAADVVVLVDVLPDASGATGSPVPRTAAESTVLSGGLRNATAVARAIAAMQAERGERTSVAIVAAGDASEGFRVAVEDLLGAGAVVDALAGVGIDHTSPEAAAACEAFRGLRGAVQHLLTASGSGQELIAAGRRDDVLAAAAIDAEDESPGERQ